MWLFTSRSFISIVQHRDNPDMLIVRGRVAGDVARFLGFVPEAEMIDLTADYRYRITVARHIVADRLLKATQEITYPNFKDSIKATWRKSAAMAIWSVMARVQREQSK